MEGGQLADAVAREYNDRWQLTSEHAPGGDANAGEQRLGNIVAMAPSGVAEARAPIRPKPIDERSQGIGAPATESSQGSMPAC